MNRNKAIKTIIDNLEGSEPVISSTGLISRELFNLEDKPNYFYMTGSLGLVSSIGLGVSLNCPREKVIVIDGDASLLMNLGSLGTIGEASPNNLLHIVLDNNAYGSCSNEQTVSHRARLEKLASVCGYPETARVQSSEEMKEKLEQYLKKVGNEGPLLLVAEINKKGRRDLPRPLNLPQVASKFKKSLK